MNYVLTGLEKECVCVCVCVCVWGGGGRGEGSVHRAECLEIIVCKSINKRQLECFTKLMMEEKFRLLLQL